MTEDGKVRYLVPFGFVFTLLAPITAPIWAYAMYREGKAPLAIAVLALGLVWIAVIAALLL